jgi:hypothetical protein
MQDVPQFVLKRLREKTVAGSHPDADLLTAFAFRVECCSFNSARSLPDGGKKTGVVGTRRSGINWA